MPAEPADPTGVVFPEVDGRRSTAATGRGVVADALRHNSIALERALVLRLPLLGLRGALDELFAQITEALVARGCPHVVAS